MKIVFVNRYFYPDHSATSQMLSDLVFHLVKRGHEVHVLSSRQRYDDARACLPAEEYVQGVRIHRVRTSHFGRANLLGRLADYLSFYVAAQRAIRRWVKAGDILVSMTDPPMISVIAQGVARNRGAIHINWLHDLFPEVAEMLRVPGLGVAMGPALRRMRDRSLRHAGCNVAISEGMRARLLALGVFKARVLVIPNWADPRCLAPIDHPVNPLRAAWGLAGCFVVGYSGNLGRAHEHETILDAAQQLSPEKAIRFLFVGSGKQSDALRGEVVTRGLKNFIFMPYQDRKQLAQSLSVADVHLVILRPELEGLILPSKFYGITAAGRPVIHIGDVQGEIPRILRAAGAGLAVAPGDGRRLARLVMELRNDPDQCRLMGRNARELLTNHFALERALVAWEQVLTAAGAGPEARPGSVYTG